ncbi:MAG: nucleoside triphosphate pyrophosphohydrolase [Nitrososphaera sp.]|nr:nucleoside triphosphate pyrophosphohydrolase [Nitrososphaera sp.]
MSIVRRLRKECPWDREQTHQSIRHALIEEAYEVVESIDHENMSELKSELGDLLLHVAMHSVMAEEEKAFTVDEVMNASMEKLIRRHPHVFGDTKVSGSHEVKANWEKLKMAEGRTSMLDGVPKELPTLLRAYRLQEKASKVGFDWKKKSDVWKKVEEEIEELATAEKSGDKGEIESELGDLLFAIVNYSRFLHVNPEIALRKSVEKFTKRFHGIEKELKAQGKKIEETTLEEMDEIWEKQKRAGEPR